MKKVLSFIIIFLLLFMCSCDFNETVPNEDHITLSITDSFKEYIKYDDVPSFTLNFNGTLNTVKEVKKSYYTVFKDNDDIILSDALADLFASHPDTIFEIVNTDEVKSRYFTVIEDGKVKNITMDCDDGKVYDEVAFVPLENGLKLSIDYCRFINGGKTYYTWRYSRSIAMFLYYPVMRIQREGKDELVLITLPNRIALHVSPELSLKSILSKDEYLKETYYTFEYYDNGKDDAKEYVWNYYENYNMSERADSFTFIYLNNKFKVELGDKNFVIAWLERI